MLLNTPKLTLHQAGGAHWAAISSLLEAHKLPLDGAQAAATEPVGADPVAARGGCGTRVSRDKVASRCCG